MLFLDSVQRRVDGAGGVLERPNHAGFRNEAEMLVPAHVFDAGLAFAEVGIGPVNQPVDGQFHGGHFGIRRHTDNAFFEITIGDSFDNFGRAADGLTVFGVEHDRCSYR